MSKEHKFSVDGKSYCYDEDSGNVYREGWDPGPVIFTLGLCDGTTHTKIGQAGDLETAVAIAKNDAKNR